MGCLRARSLPPSIFHVSIDRGRSQSFGISVCVCVRACVRARASQSLQFLSKASLKGLARATTTKLRYTCLALHGRGGGARSAEGKGKREDGGKEGRKEGGTEEALEPQGRILSTLKGQALARSDERQAAAALARAVEQLFPWPSCSNRLMGTTFPPLLEIFHLSID